ncbi:MAG: Crp/Fnr family transcriptional regulator [Acidobacteriaceae bacterium]
MFSNLLLSRLPESDLSRISPLLVPEDLVLGRVLMESYALLDQVWFPESGIVSHIQLMEDGSMAETGFVGREGLVGVHAWLGASTTPTQGIVQAPGLAMRMTTADLLQETGRPNSHLNQLIAEYSNGYLVMVEQTAGCNRLHSLEQRMCRWLCMIYDRVGASFPMRQEFLADMLGVQRPSVSVAAGALQRKGTIEYHRGRMQVTDNEQLRACACECYGVSRRQFPYMPQQELPLDSQAR